MPLVLGVDSSDRSTTVEVRDADSGSLVATGRAPHRPTAGSRREQAPTEWWSGLVTAIGACGRPDIAAVAVAGQRPGLVVTDGAGTVLRPAKLWNDLEATGHAERLVEQFGASRWAQTVGLVPSAATPVAKLAWLRTREPAAFAQIRRVMTPHDWLTFRLTGRFVTDRGDASATGYFSAAQERWRPDVLHRLDPAVDAAEWTARLPKVLGPAERADWVNASVHELLGLRGRPIVAAGTGEAMATALGVGLAAGHTAVVLDDAAAVMAVSEEPVVDPAGVVEGLADATGQHLPLVRLRSATRATAAIARILGVDLDRLGRMAMAAAPGAGGLVLRPDAAGPGTSVGEPTGAALSGIRADATPESLARAAFEGVVCAVLDAADALADVGCAADGPIALVGSGARSGAYRQLLADLAGRPVTVQRGDAHVARGACVQAAAALGGTDPAEVAEAWGLGDGLVIEPRSIDADAVRAAYAQSAG